MSSWGGTLSFLPHIIVSGPKTFCNRESPFFLQVPLPLPICLWDLEVEVLDYVSGYALPSGLSVTGSREHWLTPEKEERRLGLVSLSAPTQDDL